MSSLSVEAVFPQQTEEAHPALSNGSDLGPRWSDVLFQQQQSSAQRKWPVPLYVRPSPWVAQGSGNSLFCGTCHARRCWFSSGSTLSKPFFDPRPVSRLKAQQDSEGEAGWGTCEEGRAFHSKNSPVEYLKPPAPLQVNKQLIRFTHNAQKGVSAPLFPTQIQYPVHLVVKMGWTTSIKAPFHKEEEPEIQDMVDSGRTKYWPSRWSGRFLIWPEYVLFEELTHAQLSWGPASASGRTLTQVGQEEHALRERSSISDGAFEPWTCQAPTKA